LVALLRDYSINPGRVTLSKQVTRLRVEAGSELFARAVRHHQVGQLAEAASLYEQVLTLEPGHIQARSLLSVIIQQKDTTRFDPKLAESHFRVGHKLANSGAHEQAIEELRQAARLSPMQASYRFELGVSLQAIGQFQAAAAVYRGCLEIDPRMADAWSNLGVVLSELGDVTAAISCFLSVQRLRPAYAESYFNVGVCYASIWEHAKAVEYLSRAIALSPALAAAHLWRGKSLHVLGDIRGAIDSYRRALKYEPSSAETHWGLSLSHLMLGEFAAGWKEYEWRWKWAQFPSAKRNYSRPKWKGEPLNGRTILLHAEQGFGDTLQFVRYVPLVAEAGGRVILEVPSALYSLLREYPGVTQCIRRGDAMPKFDVHCPLMSLPLAFGTTIESIPEVVPPVLRLAEEFTERSRPSEVAERKDSPRVGLVWAGNKGHLWNTQRSFDLQQYAPLWKISSMAQFVSLQKGPAAAQLGKTQPLFAMEDGVGEAKDFADTAVVVAGLDLVITVDTAVAHLAGSMRKPVWILIPETPDWRWGLEGERTPWYPTARLFRATREGLWVELMERVAKELQMLCSARLVPKA
jgi:tetratricopeptide (TPR) repeat protein